jgi:hypothetical protein
MSRNSIATSREHALRACFNIEGEDRCAYDVALNVERLSVETCVNTIIELAESRRLPDCSAMRSAFADKLIEARIRWHWPNTSAVRLRRLASRCQSPTKK